MSISIRTLTSAAPSSRVWDPIKYLHFEHERLRPALDLLRQVPNERVARIADIGCGTGNMAPHFRKRWPGCEIVCVDSSPEMLERAKRTHEEFAAAAASNSFDNGRVHYVRSTFDEFAGDDSSDEASSFDVIFANAALHWVGAAEHVRLLPRMLKRLKRGEGGTFAFQMPDTRAQPSHLAMRTAAAELGLGKLLDEVRTTSTDEDPQFYVRLLQPYCSRKDGLNTWTTTYCHRLEGENPVADFFASSGLGVYVERLPAMERDAYVRRYRELIARAYPKEAADGSTLLFMKRFFCVVTC